MSNAIEKAPEKQLPQNVQFRQMIEKGAASQLVEVVGAERAKAAAVRTAMAFSVAARTARKPEAIYECSPASVMTCVANSAPTGLMPGGPHPMVYLIPKGGELNWWLSHRGICALAMRSGYQLVTVPVHINDDVRIEFGEVTSHEPDPDNWPETLAELKGVYVSIRRLSDGVSLGRPWMPTSAIEKRASKALTQDVWRAWPVEMAMKTTIKWAMGRGYIPLDNFDLQTALAAEAPDHEEREPRAARESDRPTGRAALGLPQNLPEAEVVPERTPEPVPVEEPKKTKPAVAKPKPVEPPAEVKTTYDDPA